MEKYPYEKHFTVKTRSAAIKFLESDKTGKCFPAMKTINWKLQMSRSNPIYLQENR